MSAIRPNCRVCSDPEIHLINAKMNQGSGQKYVWTWLEGRRRGKADIPHYSVQMLKDHRRTCLALPPLTVGRQPAGGSLQYVDDPALDLGGVSTVKPPAPRVPIATPDDPGERAKMIEELLYSSLADLSAKDLYNLHMKELDLKIAQENRLAKEGRAPERTETDTDDPGAFDEAMARAAGARPELRIVKGKRKAS